MTVFHAALQQMTTGTSLKVEVEKLVNKDGSINFLAKFKSKDEPSYSQEILKASFTVYPSCVSISTKVSEISFYQSSKDIEQKLKDHQDALRIAATLVTSEEINQHLKTVADEENEKVKDKLNKKIAKIAETHIQLTKESAIELLEETCTLVRQMHEVTNANHNGRNPIECYASFSFRTINDNGDIESSDVRVALSKRISYNLNMWGKGKREIIEKMTNAWVVKNLEIQVK